MGDLVLATDDPMAIRQHWISNSAGNEFTVVRVYLSLLMPQNSLFLVLITYHRKKNCTSSGPQWSQHTSSKLALYPPFNKILYSTVSAGRWSWRNKTSSSAAQASQKFVSEMFQTLLPDYWATTRGDEPSDTFLSLNNFNKCSRNFLQ